MRGFSHVEIIKDKSAINKKNALYIFPIDSESVELIITDKHGNSKSVKNNSLNNGNFIPLSGTELDVITGDLELTNDDDIKIGKNKSYILWQKLINSIILFVDGNTVSISKNKITHKSKFPIGGDRDYTSVLTEFDYIQYCTVSNMINALNDAINDIEGNVSNVNELLLGKADVDADNLSESNITSWFKKLGLGNFGIVDSLEPNKAVYSKAQMDIVVDALTEYYTSMIADISEIKQTLLSNDLDLDELQEVVNYIKENRKQIEALNQTKLDKPLAPTGLSVILDDGTTKPLSELNDDELAELNYKINSINTDNSNQQLSINSLQTQLNIINNWKSALTNPDADNIVNTLTELLAVFANVPEGSDLVAMLSAKVSVVDIVDGLTSFAKNRTLSANQGRVLNNAITNLQNSLNNEATARAQGDELKITKPTIDISNPDAVYKFLPLLDASGNAKRIDASNLGKNIGNSDLALTGARTLDTAGKVFSITNLPNKSADASFNKMKVQNAGGQEAVSNGKEIFKGFPAILDDTEKANFRTAMNGGWTTNTMSISNVFPRLIKNEDNPFWIDVMGSNLNLNPATMVVKVVNLLDSTETIINNNKVTLVSPNLIMVEINPSLFAQASYKIKLHNGVADLLSGQSFRIASSVENIDINAITWGKLAYTSGKENAIFPTASGGSVNYLSDSTNKAYGTDDSVVGSVKSSKLFSAGENFVIKGRLDVNYSKGSDVANTITIGVMNHNLQNSLSNNMSAYLGVYFMLNAGYYIFNSLASKYMGYGYFISVEFSIIKEGNQITTVLRNGNNYLINTKTIADVDYSMQLVVSNSSNLIENNMVITEAYSF